MGREGNSHYTSFFIYVKVSHVQKSNGRKEGGKDGDQERGRKGGRNSRYFKNTSPGLCSCYFHFLDDLLNLTPTPILPFILSTCSVLSHHQWCEHINPKEANMGR
mgnify:CR=1 FL=1